MKKILLIAFIICTVFHCSTAQDDDKKGWNPNRVFLGTGLNLGFANGFIIGVNPEVGYSIGQVLDVGLATNINYITQRSNVANTSLRYLALGGGPFVRIWPVHQFFLGTQFEYNAITLKEVTNGTVTAKMKSSATSLLAGIGYGTRVIGQNQFYTSIMVDLLKHENSPYRDQFNRMLPVFRTGFTIYLKGKRNE
ncbi:MAG: hypothetical protein N2747_10620 [Chitinophagaceae bacterium]|nr:hypothetical protein [Chitinophagaceae bacterium]